MYRVQVTASSCEFDPFPRQLIGQRRSVAIQCHLSCKQCGWRNSLLPRLLHFHSLLLHSPSVTGLLRIRQEPSGRFAISFSRWDNPTLQLIPGSVSAATDPFAVRSDYASQCRSPVRAAIALRAADRFLDGISVFACGCTQSKNTRYRHLRTIAQDAYVRACFFTETSGIFSLADFQRVSNCFLLGFDRGCFASGSRQAAERE